MAPPRPPDPHIAWPLKAFAIVAVAAAVFAGVREISGGDDNGSDDEGADASAVERAGSRRVAPGDDTQTWEFQALPRSYRITYRVAAGESTTTEVVEAVAPFDMRVETYRGASRNPAGKPVAERELSFGVVATRGSEQAETVLNVPPAFAGARASAAILDAEQLGLAERRERRTVAGEQCQVWRTGSELAGTTFVEPTAAGDVIDFCFDRRGLILEEWELADGRGVRQRLAVDVEVTDLEPDAIHELGRDATVDVNEGGGSVQEAPSDERPVGPFLEVSTGPDGFELRGRYVVVPPHPGLRDDAARGKVTASTVDVYVNDLDVIVVDRGGVLDLSDPWALDERFPDVDLGPAIGTGELLPGRTGTELRALLGQGRFLRVYGTVDAELLTAVARGLTLVEGGSGIGFDD